MKNFLITLLFLTASLFVFSQKVTNIIAKVTGDNKIAIEYQLSGKKFNQSFNVSLFVSKDDGKTFEGPMKEVSVDIGEVDKSGKHEIIWNFLDEMPITDEDLVFDVRAEVIETPIKRSWFVSYVGNTTTYLGLRIGMIGKVGWYAEGRFNVLAFETEDYEYSDDRVQDYDQPGYYQFNSNNGYSALFAGAGITYQPGKNIFLYAGAGYGKENYLYEIDKYSYENDTKTGTAYVKDPDYSIEGVEVDLGLIYRINKILLTGGATTINFKSYNWTAGIGVSF